MIWKRNNIVQLIFETDEQTKWMKEWINKYSTEWTNKQMHEWINEACLLMD